MSQDATLGTPFAPNTINYEGTRMRDILRFHISVHDLSRYIGYKINDVSAKLDYWTVTNEQVAKKLEGIGITVIYEKSVGTYSTNMNAFPPHVRIDSDLFDQLNQSNNRVRHYRSVQRSLHLWRQALELMDDVHTITLTLDDLEFFGVISSNIDDED